MIETPTEFKHSGPRNKLVFNPESASHQYIEVFQNMAEQEV